MYFPGLSCEIYDRLQSSTVKTSSIVTLNNFARFPMVSLRTPASFTKLMKVDGVISLC